MEVEKGSLLGDAEKIDEVILRTQTMAVILCSLTRTDRRSNIRSSQPSSPDSGAKCQHRASQEEVQEHERLAWE